MHVEVEPGILRTRAAELLGELHGSSADIDDGTVVQWLVPREHLDGVPSEVSIEGVRPSLLLQE